jgi:GT2 family glycosyltransferase
MKIEVIIPNYNGASLVKKNLPTVLAAVAGYKDCLVTIVDDASADADKIELGEYINKVKEESKVPVQLLGHEKNLGFSSNVDSAAFLSKADIIILLNTDVAPERDFLGPLLGHFSDENVFGVACMDKSVEGDSTILRGRGVAHWSRGFLHHGRGEVDRPDTFWLSGGSCAIRTDLFKKLGGLDPLYNPFYWEDIDLSYRAQKAGYKLIFENKSVVEHRHEVGSIKKHYKQSSIKKIAYRNQFIFIWKNITDFSLLVSHFAWLPYHLIKAIFRRDWLFLHGFFLACIRIPAIIVQRLHQKNFFKKTDKEVIFGNL